MKHIIILCDGTGCSDTDPVSTHVALLKDLISPTSLDGNVQVPFYQPGVGTTSSAHHDQFFVPNSSVRRFVQKVLGQGVHGEICSLYFLLVKEYDSGDKISFFGYSRGAFIVRVVANLVSRYGLLQIGEDDIRYYSAAKALHSGKVSKFHAICEELAGQRLANHKPGVKIVGVWDTVGSIGGIGSQLFHAGGVSQKYGKFSAELTQGIENAFHALSLDDKRREFSPMLWHLPQESSTNLQQCWFAGVHGDVGVGYSDRGLSNLTLAWMVDKCSGEIHFKPSLIKDIIQRHLHPLPKLSRWRPERCVTECRGWGLGLRHHPFQISPRKHRTPGAYSVEGGPTNESIHASVCARMQQLQHEPMVLRMFQHNADDEGRVSWLSQDGTIRIPEHPFPCGLNQNLVHNFEYHLKDSTDSNQ